MSDLQFCRYGSLPVVGAADIAEVDRDLTGRFGNKPKDVEVRMTRDRKEIKGTVR